MLKFRFAHRVAVHRGASLFYKSSAAAEHLVDSGLATVLKKTSQTITAIELTNAATGYIQGQVRANQLGLRPGSFGIRVESHPSGVFCFSHRNPWDQVVPRGVTA
jgi:hypothetical protein